MNRILLTIDGPLHGVGQIQVASAQGNVLKDGTEFWFCRCGASQDKPFCDGSHRGIDFSDRATPPSASLGTPGEGVLSVTARTDGPLKCRGPLEIWDANSKVVWRGDDTALCRCGASKTKPFCDGSHRQTGFKAP